MVTIHSYVANRLQSVMVMKVVNVLAPAAAELGFASSSEPVPHGCIAALASSI
jgi:hypothetical protein